MVRVWHPFGSLVAAVGSILASFGLLFGAFLIQFVLLGRDSINLVLNFPNFPNNVPFSTFPRSGGGPNWQSHSISRWLWIVTFVAVFPFSTFAYALAAVTFSIALIKKIIYIYIY